VSAEEVAPFARPVPPSRAPPNDGGTAEDTERAHIVFEDFPLRSEVTSGSHPQNNATSAFFAFLRAEV
jgi:hypothetical protein